ALDPHRPYIVVAANADHSLLESDQGNDTNDSTAFRTYTIGVVTNGLQPLGQFQPTDWVYSMAAALVGDGYNQVIPFDWGSVSNIPSPGITVMEGDILASQVRDAAHQLVSRPDTLPGSVVDVHFIGHSRGAVVISRALQDLNAASAPELRGGYMKM